MAADAESFCEAWRANNAICLEMLAYCEDADFELKPGKGKTIRSNFVHLVGVRRMWIESRMAKVARLIPRLDWKSATRDEISWGLGVSSEGMEALLHKMAASEKPGKWTLPMFFAYAIAHEAHHRSQIEIAWRLHGREPDEMWLMRLWEWTKKVQG